MSRHVLRRSVIVGLSVVYGAGLAHAHHPAATSSAAEEGATISTPTGTTLGRGRVAASFEFRQERFNKIPARDAHNLHHDGRHIHGKNHEEAYALTAGVGVTEHLDLFLAAPAASRTSTQVDDHGALGRGERSQGLGDVRMLAKYRFWRRGAHASMLAGIKAPTGETSDRDQSGRKFEPEQQPGSGSWDITTGLAVTTLVTPQMALSAACQYVYRGEGAQDVQQGDVIRADLAGSYALKPSGSYPNLKLILELGAQHAGRDRARGDRKVLDSGGVAVLLGPGLLLDVNERLSAYLSVPVPVYQNLGGEHEELKYGLIAGTTWTF
jgi:hypothetical protein